MKLVGLVRKWTEVSQILVSESEVKIVTRGIHYKFAILNKLKINIVGKLSPFPLGISEFDETCIFEKRKSKVTTGRIFRLRGSNI